MQFFFYYQTADGERRSGRSEIPITLYDPITNLMASLLSGVQGSYDNMMTEVFRKGMIATPNSLWNYGLMQQAGYGTCDQRPKEVQHVLELTSGKRCHRVFRRVLHTTSNEKLETLGGVGSALATGQLELYYQSKITLRDRTHSGFEALLRWNKGDGQVLPPGSFMAAFDDPSLSMEVGNYVIASAIGQARRWMIARVPFVSIAINLSASQFRDDQLGNRILNAIAATNLDPRMIEVEVTEGVFLSATSDAVLNACKVLKKGGVRIAFDDFGTGFASLTHLRDFPVDTIKIDRSFITRLGEGQNTATIVNAMVGLAHNLSMSIVAEGVETQAQAEFLDAIGCDAAQGYLFARPLPAAVAAQQLRYPHRLPDFGCTPGLQP
jgi:EAL domain-containing protein (putative c-di-GMP-specific phosphodiesterase class I)